VAIRRGTIYHLTTPGGAIGHLVLTNEQWNDADTKDASGALIYREEAPGRVAIPGTPLFAGPLFATPKVTLTNAIGDLSAAQLRPIEDFVRDVLAIPSLTSTPPRAPSGVPGTITYPRWAQIYYAGPPLGRPPQTKRRVVVSRDEYNRAVTGAICVTTTTSPNRGGQGFPTLSDGTKAACMVATFLPNATIRFGARQVRPDPSQFFTQDMATIAVGLADAFDL
jgi:hypothetical protein